MSIKEFYDKQVQIDFLESNYNYFLQYWSDHRKHWQTECEIQRIDFKLLDSYVYENRLNGIYDEDY